MTHGVNIILKESPWLLQLSPSRNPYAPSIRMSVRVVTTVVVIVTVTVTVTVRRHLVA